MNQEPLCRMEPFEKKDIDYREINSPPPAPDKPLIEVLERNRNVTILGVKYRVHSITHGGRKVQLRRIF